MCGESMFPENILNISLYVKICLPFLPTVQINKEALSLTRPTSKGTVTMKCMFSSHASCRAVRDCDPVKD